MMIIGYVATTRYSGKLCWAELDGHRRCGRRPSLNMDLTCCYVIVKVRVAV
jgi:hypothetical protein